jgi:Probable Zinc-ribbon domain
MGKRKYTFEEVKSYIEGRGFELLQDYYENSHAPMKIKCKCGNENWMISFKNIQKVEYGCFKCSYSKGEAFRFTFEEVVEQLKEKNYLLLDDKYRSCDFKINVENMITGYRYYMTFYHLMRGGSNEFSSINPFREFNFNLLLNNFLSSFYLLNFTDDTKHSRVMLKCFICGETWETSVSMILQKRNCPYCTHHKASSRNNLYAKFPELCNEWNYTKNEGSPSEFSCFSHKKVWWKCLKCNHEWKMSIDARTGKENQSCPKCQKSKGEKRIEEYLINSNIPYISQFKFDDCKSKRPLPFDFAIFYNEEKIDLAGLIEYDGELHYMPYRRESEEDITRMLNLQKRDEIKTKYCLDNKIFLLRIPYWDKPFIKEILDKEILSLRKEELIFAN